MNEGLLPEKNNRICFSKKFNLNLMRTGYTRLLFKKFNLNFSKIVWWIRFKEIQRTPPEHNSLCKTAHMFIFENKENRDRLGRAWPQHNSVEFLNLENDAAGFAS